jgi:Arylsulfotransferase (ASST)
MPRNSEPARWRVCAGRAILAVALGAWCVGNASAAVRSAAQHKRIATPAAALRVALRPALQPAFDPSVTNYVTRCEPREHVRVFIYRAHGVPVSVGRQSARSGNFSVKLRLTAGQRFTIRTRTGAAAQTYSVRCLPVDFPHFTVQVNGPTQAAYYLVTPTLGHPVLGPPYVVLFDNHGTPVWWYQELNGVPTNASLLSNGNFLWDVDAGSNFGYPVTTQLEVHRLDGTLVRTSQASTPTPTDSYEALQLPSGDFLTTGYALRKRADLSALGEGINPVLDATFDEIAPDGTLVYAWDSSRALSPLESVRWWWAWVAVPPLTKPVWDWQHIDSVAPAGDGYLVSMCHTDAIYLVRRSDGAIEWKLGGTQTPQSLTIIGAPDSSSLFGCPSDARVLPDGTVSVHDNGAFLNRPPRVLRFQIDPQARTATLVQTINGPANTASACCGSDRQLPGGDWVVDWGQTGIADEVGPAGALLLRMSFAAPTYSYRVVPVLRGQLDAAALTAGMDKMYPRSHTHPRRREKPHRRARHDGWR